MRNSDHERAGISSQVEAARERSRQKAFATQLQDVGLVPSTVAVQFVSNAELSSVMDRARDSGGQGDWRRRSGWDEISPEVRAWLNGHDRVVLGFSCVIACGPWFAEHIDALHGLWKDLYFYSPDGRSGYLVNHDLERGFETVTW